MDAPSPLPDRPQGPAESYAPYGRESVDCKGDTTGNPLAEPSGPPPAVRRKPKEDAYDVDRALMFPDGLETVETRAQQARRIAQNAAASAVALKTRRCGRATQLGTAAAVLAIVILVAAATLGHSPEPAEPKAPAAAAAARVGAADSRGSVAHGHRRTSSAAPTSHPWGAAWKGGTQTAPSSGPTVATGRWSRGQRKGHGGNRSRGKWRRHGGNWSRGGGKGHGGHGGQGKERGRACFNGKDDDKDGKVDCADSHCRRVFARFCQRAAANNRSRTASPTAAQRAAASGYRAIRSGVHCNSRAKRLHGGESAAACAAACRATAGCKFFLHGTTRTYARSKKWCSPSSGSMLSASECKLAAKEFGMNSPIHAGKEWTPGCLIHGGNVYYSPYVVGAAHSQPTDEYICRVNISTGGCPGAFPHLKTQRSVEPGKLCWKTDRGAKAGTSCADWCLLKQYAKENPGGHLDNCPRNICKTQGSKKETGHCWQEFTKSASCTEGWRKARSYTFYQTVVDPATDCPKPVRSCPACCKRGTRRRLFMSHRVTNTMCKCSLPALENHARSPTDYEATAVIGDTGSLMTKAAISFSGTMSVIKSRAPASGRSYMRVRVLLHTRLGLTRYSTKIDLLLDGSLHKNTMSTCVKKGGGRTRCTCRAKPIRHKDMMWYNDHVPYDPGMAYVHTRCPGGSTTSCLDVYKLYAGDWKKDNGVPTILLEFAHPTLDTQAQEAVLRSLHFSVPVRGRVRVTISGKADFKQKKPRPYATLMKQKALSAPCTPKASAHSAPCKCIFPFKYHGVVYRRCTQVDETELWCATKVDRNGEYKAPERGRNNGGKYAYCSSRTACNYTLGGGGKG